MNVHSRLNSALKDFMSEHTLDNAQISAVWAVGLAEGLSHVNWRKVLTIVLWWIGSLIPVFLAAAAVLAQGTLKQGLSWLLHMHWL